MEVTKAIADAYGLTYDADNNSRVSGGAGNDKIVMSTGVGVDFAYGGAGNDTFMFKANQIEAEHSKETAKIDDVANPAYVAGYAPAGVIDKVIHDFEGAGTGWASSGSDFLSFQGYGAGSTFTLNTSLGYDGVAGNADGSKDDVGPRSFYYTLHNGTTGTDITILIQSMNGQALSMEKGDFQFYA